MVLKILDGVKTVALQSFYLNIIRIQQIIEDEGFQNDENGLNFDYTRFYYRIGQNLSKYRL